MVEPDTLDQPIHPEGALLPWYLNGTLREDERRQVDQHLSSCAACRAELNELAQLNVELHEVYAAQSEPSTRIQRAVLAQVQLEAFREAREVCHRSTVAERIGRLVSVPVRSSMGARTCCDAARGSTWIAPLGHGPADSF